MAGKKRSSTDFPNKTRSEFAKILEKARKTRYVRSPYLAMRDASLIAFEFLFKTRVSEGVGRVFPEDRKDRHRSEFLDKYEGIKLDDFEIYAVKGREVLRCRIRVLKRGCRRKICENCGGRNGLKANYCRECGSTLAKIRYDSRLKEHHVWDSVRLDDPFTYYIIEWLDFLRQNFKDPNPRVWGITRQRAWQINKNQDAIRNLESKSEQIRRKWVRAILNPKDPAEFHLSRFLYYEKKCPFCLTDLAEEIDGRMETKTCLLCGKGSLSEYREEDFEKIKNQLSSFDKHKKELDQSRSEIEKGLRGIEKEIEKLNESRSMKSDQKSKLTKRLDELKNIEDQLHRRDVISKELEEITREIDKNKKLVAQNEENIKKIDVELDELKKVKDGAKMAMKTEIGSSMSQIKEKFSTFIKLATNNEASGTISKSFVPILNGRQIYHEEFAVVLVD